MIKSYCKVALSYLVFGAVWVVFSDRVAELLEQQGKGTGIYHTGKGLFFVLVSSCLIFFLTKRSFQKQERDEGNRQAAVRRTVAEAHRILRNYLNQMQLVTIEAENCVDFDRTTLELARRISDEAAEGLDRLEQVANGS